MKLQRFIEQIVQDNSGGMEMTEVHVHIISALQHAKISDFKYSRAKNWGKSGVDTAGWWSLKYLWSYPTKEEAYNHIKKDLKKWGLI